MNLPLDTSAADAPAKGMRRRRLPEGELLVTVTDLAADLGITARTLRFYEDQGLIQPRRLGATRAEATLADGIKCPAPTPHMRDRRSDGVIAR